MYQFPFYKQYDTMQCGIACLKMICRYYHKIYSLEYFSKICGSTTEGVSMLSIKKNSFEHWS